MGAHGLNKRSVILVAIKGLGIGGAEKLISEGARFWDRDRFEYHVAYVSPLANQLVPDLQALGIPVTCLGSKRGMTPGSVWRLRKLTGDIGADIVHVHSPIVGVAARVSLPVPLVYTEHNVADSYRQPTRTLNRLTYSRNSVVTTVSEAVATALSGFRGPVPVVVENGVAVTVAPTEAAAARNQLGLGTGDPLVVHVGNIRPGKGHETLTEAVKYLPDNVTVVSIGAERRAGDLDRVRDAATKAGVANRLKFLGRRRDALSYIAAADIYVNPADHEGLPVTILEALALARPVVATAVGGVASVVRDGETGVLVRPHRPIDLADAVQALLDNPVQAAHLGEQGRRLVEEKFGLESMIASFEEIYAELLNG